MEEKKLGWWFIANTNGGGGSIVYPQVSTIMYVNDKKVSSITTDDVDYSIDGSIHFELTKISPLYEVSPCVFPAYEATHIEARAKDVERIKERMHEAWKMRMIKKLKGNSENGIESINDKEKAGSEEE